HHHGHDVQPARWPGHRARPDLTGLLAHPRLNLREACRRAIEDERRLGAAADAQRIAALTLRHLVKEPAGFRAGPTLAQARDAGAGMAQADLGDGAAAGIGILRDAPFAGEDPALPDNPHIVSAVGCRVVDLGRPAAARPQPGLVADAAAGDI